jgi:Fungal trichothecene efflux pump (TRI12)
MLVPNHFEVLYSHAYFGKARWLRTLTSLLVEHSLLFVDFAKTYLGGMTLNGIGAGINELTALAATSEIAPTRKRGLYVSCLIFTILPFVPSVLYAQLIAYYGSWRYIGVICGVWSFLGVALTAIFYFPPPRVNSKGFSRSQILAEIDWFGGFLSILGIVLFIMGLQWGGYQVS